MKVLVTGANGMLGIDLSREFAASHQVVPTNTREMDVTEPDVVFRVFEEVQPQIVVHLAGATDVDRCEREPDWAYRTNTLGVRNVALACQRTGSDLVYMSTLAVFDGNKSEPYTEFDSPNPQSVYSRSKYQAECVVRTVLYRHYIVRAGWLFGGHAGDKKFVAKILELARQRSSLQVVDDKFGSPTYTVDLSKGLLKLIETGLYGCYHMVGGGAYCSRLEFARAVLEAAAITSCKLEPVSSAYFPLAAPRPRMEAGRNYHLELAGMDPIRPWRDALAEYVWELAGHA
jgi:dTDP-4-dehydrorhamnose reductase